MRAILWQHLGQATGQAVPTFEDPNELVDVAPFAQRVEALNPEDQDALGRDYALLWARTFRTLVRHLRGHPERALAVFAQEALPYLLGQRVAARIEAATGERTRILSDAPLPIDYLAGMAAGFAALAGAQAQTQVIDGKTIDVQHRLRARDRTARLVRRFAQLRIPLLITSLLAACVGLALAGSDTATPYDVAAILVGTLAAQSGANALHDLRSKRPQHGLSGSQLSRPWLLFQAMGSYAVAASALAWLLPGRPLLLAFAASGFLLGGLYVRFKDQGWGPALATLTHGPLTVLGAAYGAGHHLDLTALLASAPTGFLAAAILYLDDLADSPLDEAAGTRTLVLRLPAARRLWMLILLLATAFLAIIALRPQGIMLAAVALLAGTAFILAQDVRRHLDDPTGLAWARSGLLAHYTLTAATAATILLRTP